MTKFAFNSFILGLLMISPSANAVEKWPAGYFKASDDTSLGQTVQTTWVLHSIAGHDAITDLSTLKFSTRTNSISERVLSVRVESCGETYRGFKSMAVPEWRREQSLELCEGQENNSASIPSFAIDVRNAFTSMIMERRLNIYKPHINWSSGLLIFKDDEGKSVAVFKIEAAE